ncbi:hypothetical protein BJ742DRAFT_740136 [Cladochytrium replicatum]|nr:hypothetical protein BJ742DRAFT_740136 [Cladochytrium replicatum]
MSINIHTVPQLMFVPRHQTWTTRFLELATITLTIYCLLLLLARARQRARLYTASVPKVGIVSGGGLVTEIDHFRLRENHSSSKVESSLCRLNSISSEEGRARDEKQELKVAVTKLSEPADTSECHIDVQTDTEELHERLSGPSFEDGDCNTPQIVRNEISCLIEVTF